MGIISLVSWPWVLDACKLPSRQHLGQRTGQWPDTSRPSHTCLQKHLQASGQFLISSLS